MTEKSLKAHMLGGFSLDYGGSQLDCPSGGSSQFVNLLQIVLHHPDGPRPQDLQDALFGGRHDAVEDVGHAVRSVVYNANRRLEKAGLPGTLHIVQKKGVCVWAGKVPVEDDSRQFEAQAEEALADGRTDRLFEACMSYGGEFLPGNAGAVWILSEARRYRALFTKCAEAAVNGLREEGRFEEMHALGTHAASACPLSGWERVSVEALNALGRHDEAMELYRAASKKYFAAQGVKLDAWGAGGGKVDGDWHWAGTGMDEIQKALDTQKIVRVKSYMSFRDLYGVMAEMSDRTGMSLYLMSVSALDLKGNMLNPGPVLNRVAEKLERAVEDSIRVSDAACHCGGCRYLILLPDITGEDCSIVKRRIASIFYEKGRSMKLVFEVRPVGSPALRRKEAMDGGT